MLRSRFEGLIFDVSGTLWNDLDQVFYANWGAVEKLGFSKFPSSFGRYAGQPLNLEGFKANAKGSCVEMFRSFAKLEDISDEDLDKLYREQLAVSCKKHPVSLYEGIEDLLAYIPQRIGVENVSVVSSHPQDSLDEDLERLGIRNYFREVEGGVHSKKDTIIRHTSHLIQANFLKVAYIGDTQSDMRAANEAGVYALGVSYGYQNPQTLREGKPRIVRASPQTLRRFLFPDN